MAEHDREPSDATRLDPRCGYDRWSASYDDADPTTRLDQPALLELCGPLLNRCVLDLGCGTGRLSRLLSSHGGKVVGADLSLGMLQRAAEQSASRIVGWVQARAESLPLCSSTFDVVVSGLILDHLAQLPPCFCEIVRVLKPRGRLVLSAIHPDLQRITGPAVTFKADEAGGRIAGYIHSTEEIVAGLVEAGLCVTTVESLRLPPSLAARAPQWTARINRPVLLVVAAHRSG